MPTYTTRLGLIKPSGSSSPAEPVDVAQLNSNADNIDRWMGCILVTDGTTPGVGDLYDGAIVRERTSGYIWEARKNGGGTFDKYPISYPCSFQGYTTAFSQASVTPGAFVKTGCANFDGAGSINTSAANITGGMFVVPMAGIWAWTCHVSFQVYTEAYPAAYPAAYPYVSERGIALWLDAAARSNETQVQTLSRGSSYDTRLSISGSMTFSKNAEVGIGIWQYNSDGAALAVSNYLSMSLITPIGAA